MMWEAREVSRHILGMRIWDSAIVETSTSELRVRLAPLNRFKPSSKTFY